MTKPRSAYGPKERVRIKFPAQGRTKQAFKKDCDINNIMAKYVKTGVITHGRTAKPEYGFAPATDFHTAMNLITEAEQQFEGLPSKLRLRFKNDPAEFLSFCEDPNNRSEAALLGLLETDEVVAEPAGKEASDSASAPVPTPPETAPTPE